MTVLNRLPKTDLASEKFHVEHQQVYETKSGKKRRFFLYVGRILIEQTLEKKATT